MAKEKNNTKTQQENGKSERVRIDRKEQKKNLLERHPEARLFIANSRLGRPLFSALTIIDAVDEAILNQWAYGDVDDEDVKQWNTALTAFKEQAQNLRELGIASVAKAGSTRNIHINVLKKEVELYIKKQENVKQM